MRTINFSFGARVGRVPGAARAPYIINYVRLTFARSLAPSDLNLGLYYTVL